MRSLCVSGLIGGSRNWSRAVKRFGAGPFCLHADGDGAGVRSQPPTLNTQQEGKGDGINR